MNWACAAVFCNTEAENQDLNRKIFERCYETFYLNHTETSRHAGLLLETLRRTPLE